MMKAAAEPDAPAMKHRTSMPKGNEGHEGNADAMYAMKHRTAFHNA